MWWIVTMAIAAVCLAIGALAGGFAVAAYLGQRGETGAAYRK